MLFLIFFYRRLFRTCELRQLRQLPYYAAEHACGKGDSEPAEKSIGRKPNWQLFVSV